MNWGLHATTLYHPHGAVTLPHGSFVDDGVYPATGSTVVVLALLILWFQVLLRRLRPLPQRRLAVMVWFPVWPR